MASAFSPKRSRRFYMQMSEELYVRLYECSKIAQGGAMRSMSEIAHVGLEMIVDKLEKEQKKEGK